MTPAEKLAALHAWETHVKAISAVYEADRLACGVDIESPRWRAVYGLLEAHTMMVAQAIAPDDATAKDVAGWLDWWQEMDFGAKAGRAGYLGKKVRESRTLEDLLWIIEARP